MAAFISSEQGNTYFEFLVKQKNGKVSVGTEVEARVTDQATALGQYSSLYKYQ